MAKLKLVPSTYSVSSTSYLSVSNPTNMYTDTDSDTYATLTNSQNGTTSYYLYVRGFNFDAVKDLNVNSFTIRFKARQSGGTASTSYRPYLVNNTSQLTCNCNVISTTTNTIEFTNISSSWEDIVSMGSNFGIRINCRRASRGTTATFYLYGFEIEVDYTPSVKHTLTITNNDNINVTPNTTTEYPEGENVNITIDEVNMPNVLLDGVDITEQFEEKTLDNSFTGNAVSSTSSGISSGSNYVSYAVGYSAENPNSESVIWYGSQSATVDSQYAQYSFDVSSIPSNATDIVVKCKVAGKAENSTYSHQSGGRYSEWGLLSGSTKKGTQIHATSTSTQVLEFTDTGSWTRSELDNLVLRHYVGYYGGATLGITLTIEYSLPGSLVVFIYVLTMDSDHAIVISKGGNKKYIYVKSNGTWGTRYSKAYVKQNGTWVETDITQVFNTNNKYVKKKL